MKVAIFTQLFQYGGAEKRASVYASYLYMHGVDVSAITMRKSDEEYFIEPGLPRYYIADSMDEYFKLSKKQRLNKLREHLLSINPDVAIAFLPRFSFYAALAIKFDKRLKHIKLVYSVALYQRKYSFFERCIDFMCCLFADRITLQCEEQLKCNRLFKKKCQISYNPIKDQWNDEIKRSYDKLSIISAGRLTKQKNFETAIRAVKQAHALNENISFDIYGDGPLKDKLVALINKLEAHEYIKIHPFSYSLNEEFVKHNVYILSSRFEGFPNSLAEAMMSGLVCLSTPCSTGPKDIIDDQKNGYLVKNEEELSSRLLELASNKELCTTLSKEARKKAKLCFEDSVVLPQYLEEISKIV